MSSPFYAYVWLSYTVLFTFFLAPLILLSSVVSITALSLDNQFIFICHIFLPQNVPHNHLFSVHHYCLLIICFEITSTVHKLSFSKLFHVNVINRKYKNHYLIFSVYLIYDMNKKPYKIPFLKVESFNAVKHILKYAYSPVL